MEFPLWLGVQSSASTCGPTSLKYALCALGFSPREGTLAKLAGTTWRGTTTDKLIETAGRWGVDGAARIVDDVGSAWEWLLRNLEHGPVILDVDEWDHYVVAVSAIADRVFILDPTHYTDRGDDDYADGLLYTKLGLQRRWSHEGQYSGISLRKRRHVPYSCGPRLRFSEAAVQRYSAGREWVLDEYLVDCAEIAQHAVRVGSGRRGPLGNMLRRLGDEGLVSRVAHWYGAEGAETNMVKAHLDDLAVAADAMQLSVPQSAVEIVSADAAAILTLVLTAD